MIIENAICIVTGGINGLGKETTLSLLSKKAIVIVFDISKPISNVNNEFDYQEVDITNDIQVEQAVKYVYEKYGRIDVLINCAGIGYSEEIINDSTTHNTEIFLKVININLIGTFICCKHTSFYMAKNKDTIDNEKGVIINIASIAGIEGNSGQVAYAASKGGVIGMSMPLARDLSKYNIRVSTISPGPIDTGIKMPPNSEKLKKFSVIGRFGKPNEFSMFVLHIIENTYIAGSNIRLDGGLIKPHI